MEILKKTIFLILIILFVSTIIYYSLVPSAVPQESFEQRRTRVLNELYSAIDEAATEGKYKCCIDPPCTMCYLGKWIWKDGSCYCDDMIAKGEFDKVCPQCKKGIEEGKCKSSEGVCDTVLK